MNEPRKRIVITVDDGYIKLFDEIDEETLLVFPDSDEAEQVEEDLAAILYEYHNIPDDALAAELLKTTLEDYSQFAEED